MNPFEMVVLIVAIVMLASVLRSRGRARTELAETGEADAMRAEIARLKDRVEVLERIATDRSRRLSDEIEDLRR